MTVNVSDVLSIYKKTGGIIDDAGSAASPLSSSSGGASFGDVLKSFGTDAVSTLHAGEEAAMGQISGTKTDLAGVASAISKAEIVLDEITAVRDKVIAAYQSISSSQI